MWKLGAIWFLCLIASGCLKSLAENTCGKQTDCGSGYTCNMDTHRCEKLSDAKDGTSEDAPDGLTVEVINDTGVGGDAMSDGIDGFPDTVDDAIGDATGKDEGEEIPLDVSGDTVSQDATLLNLTLSAGALSPAFTPDHFSYTAWVYDYTLIITATPTVSEAHATVTVNGTEVISGNPSPEISLNLGQTNISIQVTAQDGITEKLYSVAVSRRHWVHPASLDEHISPDGLLAGSPEVAMDNGGNAIIVWVQDDGSNNQIFKSEYRNGTWTHPGSLSDNISPNGENTDNPQVAMDDSGNALIVWEEFDGSSFQIFKSKYRDSAWIHPASLSDNISIANRNAFFPQVAMDNNGNAIIVWHQKDAANIDQIFMSEYRNGLWKDPMSLADNISPDGQAAEFAQVAMDDNGNAIIVWSQSDGARQQIFMSEYRNKAWTHPGSLSGNISPDGQDASSPQVAMDDNGNAIIAWSQSDGSTTQIFKSEYRSHTWTHPESLSDNISTDGEEATLPRVAMDNKGNAIIVWTQSDGITDKLYKSEYRQGKWTLPDSLTNAFGTIGLAGVASAAMDNNGNAIIVWDELSDSGHHNIFKSEYRNGNWTYPKALTDHINPDGIASFPEVAMDDDGNAVIVWSQESGQDEHIFMSEYR